MDDASQAHARPPRRCCRFRVCCSGRSVYDEYGFTWDAHGYHADLLDVETAYAAFFVAELEGRIVGTAELSEHGSLERLYVLRDARGAGAGSALLAAVAAEARRRGHARLEIWSDKRFEDAHRLYLRQGARLVGERLHDDPDSSHAWGLVPSSRRAARRA